MRFEEIGSSSAAQREPSSGASEKDALDYLVGEKLHRPFATAQVRACSYRFWRPISATQFISTTSGAP